MDQGDIKLNIGAGNTYIPGFINIDLASYADISLDIGKTALPFEDNTATLVFSYHTLEHVENYLFALGEIHRVLKHGGVLLVGLPYCTSTKYHLVNPYHLHNFNEFSFDLFDPKIMKGSAVEANSIMFRKVFHRFHYLSMFGRLPRFLRDWCRMHLFNVVQKIDIGLVCLKDEQKGIQYPLRNELMVEFDKCLQNRKRYNR